MVKTTYVFKRVGTCEIKADVYREPDDVRRAVIVFIHGGALICGSRAMFCSDQIAMYLGAGYAVVSIDYRLAPETKIAPIIEDVRDALAWVRTRGQNLLNIDPDRMAVVGGSAGGYLTLMAGFITERPPRVLVSFYGYGDIVGDWYSKPDPFYCRSPVISEAKARSCVGREVVSEGNPDPRRTFYLYCRQNGLWPTEVGGHDPVTERAWFDGYCPIKNVSAKYPPTLLLHGDKDTDVPHEQSVMMAERLAQVGVEHELVTIPGGGHAFDYAGIQDERVAHAFDRTLAFLRKHV